MRTISEGRACNSAHLPEPGRGYPVRNVERWMKRLESMLIPAGVAARDKEIRSHMLPIPWMAQPSLEKQATTSKPISPGGNL